MRFCGCFKLSTKIQKLRKEKLTLAITKCTLTGLVQQAKKSCWKCDLKLCMCILHNIASSFHCHTCWLEFKMLLPPVKKQKTRACVREIQVHKLWTNVYSQKCWQLWLWAREHNNNNISLHYPSIVHECFTITSSAMFSLSALPGWSPWSWTPCRWRLCRPRWTSRLRWGVPGLHCAPLR